MIDKDDFTEKEYQALKETAERKGWEWVEEHTDLILDQARLVHGEL